MNNKYAVYLSLLAGGLSLVWYIKIIAARIADMKSGLIKQINVVIIINADDSGRIKVGQGTWLPYSYSV